MSFIRSSSKNFKCEILAKSTTLSDLLIWLNLFPIDNFFYLGLPIGKKRFTILKSPLGNKRAKDQYELCEYSYYIRIINPNPAILLLFLDLIKKSGGVKLKISLSNYYY